jgi:3-oxoacyl-[acyl-carrier protein] reductase
MAKEWGRYNVNVNCVGFGLIETRLTQPLAGAAASIEVKGHQIAVGVQPKVLESVKAVCPLGRAGMLRRPPRRCCFSARRFPITSPAKC